VTKEVDHFSFSSSPPADGDFTEVLPRSPSLYDRWKTYSPKNLWIPSFTYTRFLTTAGVGMALFFESDGRIGFFLHIGMHLLCE